MITIEPHGLYTRSNLLELLGTSPEFIADLEAFFGLLPLCGGGPIAYRYSGRNVMASLQRHATGKRVPRRRNAPGQKQRREWRKARMKGGAR